MESVPGEVAVGSFDGAYASVPPLGLGGPRIESLTGYVVRVGNAFTLPPAIFVKRVLDCGKPDARVVVSPRPWTLNGAGETAAKLARGLVRLTGSDAVPRLSYLGLVELFQQFGASDRGLLSSSRRWCPECWRGDGSQPYERKLWWLALAEACPVHECLLEHRCGACGRAQPSLTRAVRLQVCSFCGHGLLEGSSAVRLPPGQTSHRLLWYALEGAKLVHAAEAAVLMDADETAAIDGDCVRLARAAEEKGIPAVARELEEARRRTRPHEAWLEEIFSALWRLDAGVLDLFSPNVRATVKYDMDGLSFSPWTAGD